VFSEWLCSGANWSVDQAIASGWRSTLTRLADALRATISEVTGVVTGRLP
jgi:hypothetical protein